MSDVENFESFTESIHYRESPGSPQMGAPRAFFLLSSEKTRRLLFQRSLAGDVLSDVEVDGRPPTLNLRSLSLRWSYVFSIR